jgi:hypothetical protein
MAGVATARDVEEVIQKLHSDRARVRDVSTPPLAETNNCSGLLSG